jgi:hypothetical protein
LQGVEIISGHGKNELVRRQRSLSWQTPGWAGAMASSGREGEMVGVIGEEICLSRLGKRGK